MPTTDANDAFSSQNNQQQSSNPAVEAYLKHLSDQLERLIKATAAQSQSAAADQNRSRSYQSAYDELFTSGGSRKRGSAFRRRRQITEDFGDAVEEGLINAILGSDYKNRIGRAVADFADTFGLDLANIKEQLGRELGKQVGEALKGTALGQRIMNAAKAAVDNIFNRAASGFQSGVAGYDQAHGTSFSSAAADWIRRTRANQNRVPSQQEAQSSGLFGSIFNGGSASRQSVGDLGSSREYAFRAAVVNITADVVNCSSSNFGRMSPDSSGIDIEDATSTLVRNGIDSAMNSAGEEMGASAAAEGLGSSLPMLAEGGAAAAEGLGSAAAAGEGAAAAVAGLGSSAAVTIPQIAIAIDAVELITAALKYALGPAIEGTKKLFDAMKKSGLRYMESREKQVEFEKKRMEDDLETIVRKPFEILEAAANNLYDAWDNNIRKINATQGYNKEDLQSLMGAFAQRLRDEGLSEVISTTDIISSLSSVLDSGLSGKAAEEFAYNAAKLNAAVPTQDFFGYASTYASIAANAVKNGMSQTQALEYANSQLYAFADNVLYASRNLAGGFTTGLRDAQSLFEQSVQIAQASKTGNAANISGVLTAVSAVVGAIAPDLATSITDVIYRAAVGGNASELVALRSLANINASNTEFLRKLAQDPQSVFAELFKNLANMQNMADGAWMEVAEGLSSVFGVSMDAFARVDFAYLADVIANMNSNSTALQDNLELLAEGQTTTNEEQLKIAQINKYMIEEGLSYVLDNDAARAIQQHMWEEQIAQQLMEAEYGVNLHGAALDFLQGLRKTVDSILNFLNPLGFLFKLVKGVADSAEEYRAQEADLTQLLELGKVGQGNATAMYQLTTRGTNLNVTDALVNLMGGSSAYASASARNAAGRDWLNGATAFGAFAPGLGPLSTAALSSMVAFDIASNLAAEEAANQRYAGKVSSRYRWGMLGKSQAATIRRLTTPTLSPILTSKDIQSAKEEANTKLLAEKMGKLLDESYIKQFASDTSKSYEDWVESASKFGISDMDAALDAIGKNEEDLKGIFNDFRTEAASSEARRREEKEEGLWDATLIYQPAVEALLDTNNELTTTTNSLLTTTNELLTANNMTLSYVLKKETEFYDAWVSYFVSHTTYDRSYDYSKVAEIRNKERNESDSAVYALAEALSKNTVDLRDPAVQTNALLSQILLVVNAMLQRNNQTGATTLLGTLAGLALGGETPTI